MEQTLEKTSELTVIANKIDVGLAAFEQRKSELTELEKEAHGLKIESIDDKEGINQVSTIRKKLKVARVEIEKEGKSMRDPLTQMSKIISGKEKELIAIIEPTEKELLAQEKWVEGEKQRIENEMLQRRSDALAEYGYKLEYSALKVMGEEEFTQTVTIAKEQFEKEQAEKAEADRLEKERIESERKAKEEEDKRMEAQRKELEEMRQKQDEQQRIIDEQNAKLLAEKKRLEDEKAAIEAAKQKEIDDKARAEEIRVAQENAAEQARLKAIEDAKEAERIRIEAEEKERIAAEREAALLPDKQKILNYIAAVKSVPVPDLEKDEAKSVMFSIQDLISRFDNYATEKAETL